MAESNSRAENPDAYLAINVSTLRGDLKIFFDVFIRVGAKNILYCRQGDSFEGARLERLRSKKLDKMYIRRQDEGLYNDYLNESVNQAYDKKSGKPLEIRCEVIQGFQQSASEKFMENPDSKLFYDQLRNSSGRFTQFLADEPESIRHFLAIKNIDQNVAHHGFNVATLATSMIREDSPSHINQLPVIALGCFLHDIDLIERGLVLKGSLDELSAADRTAYLEHPTKGAEILQGKGFVDPMVFKIISQHEENAQGSGFPRGINTAQIDPLVLYVATANAYDRLISFEGLSSKDALKKLHLEKLGLYPFEYLQLLQNILKRAQAQ